MKVHIHWFRRDLRFNDNVGLFHGLKSGLPVVPVFIFDDEILEPLPEGDHRVNFIYDQLERLHWKLKTHKSGFRIYRNTPLKAWKQIIRDFEVASVSFNHDYEPDAMERDAIVSDFLETQDILVNTYKDHVVFEKNEVVKQDGDPYTVYTPYKRQWMAKFRDSEICVYNSGSLLEATHKMDVDFPSKDALNIKPTTKPYPRIRFDTIKEYHKTRDYPAQDGTSNLGTHLRFGTVSPRVLALKAAKTNQTFLSELIWREFFIQILFHFPHVVKNSFRKKYDRIDWINDEKQFEKWCKGETGFPMVDAGMRELNETGFMHNRVRMITASFLCKHLLIDWRWGERYFAEKLYDYDLASNNGNWQWAAGTGCDAAPYFRVFNPETQLRKFDPTLKYVKEWVPEFGTMEYKRPMVEHKAARQRALDTYKMGLEKVNA